MEKAREQPERELSVMRATTTRGYFKVLLLAAALFCSQMGRAQVVNQIVSWSILLPDDIASKKIEMAPTYPGGGTALDNYFYINLNTAADLAEKSTIRMKGYQSVLSFKLSEEGKISDISLIRNSPELPALNEKIRKAVLNMAGWTPCVVDGKAVAIKIGFILNLNSSTFKLAE
jgi:hypothetical protein